MSPAKIRRRADDGRTFRRWVERTGSFALKLRFYSGLVYDRPYFLDLFVSKLIEYVFGKRRLADSDLYAPTLPEFRRAIREGRLKAGSPETKHILGKMYLTSFFTGVAPPGLDAAV